MSINMSCSALILSLRFFIWASTHLAKVVPTIVKMTLAMYYLGSFFISFSMGKKFCRLGYDTANAIMASIDRPSNYGTLMCLTWSLLIRFFSPDASCLRCQMVTFSNGGRYALTSEPRKRYTSRLLWNLAPNSAAVIYVGWLKTCAWRLPAGI